MSDETFAVAFVDSAQRTLQQSTAKITHCLDQLSDERLWWRPSPNQNSIGILVVHLCGNIRQWIVSGVGGAPDTRNRPAEFAGETQLPKDELRASLHATIAEAASTLAAVDPGRLLVPCKIQGFDATPMSAIIDSVSHFQGHTQEIILLTRLQLGDAYKFHWVPTTPEELSGGSV